jgi:phosphoserine phosphatase
MAYQPMLELLAYLRANGFRTYIVPGGPNDLVRRRRADFNERSATVHIQVAVLFPQSVRDSSITFTEPQ